MVKNKRGQERTLSVNTRPTTKEFSDAAFGSRQELLEKTERLQIEVDTLREDIEHALVRTPNGETLFRSFTLSTTGLDPEKHKANQIHESDWHLLGDVLFDMQESIQWLLGDWIRLGEIHYNKTYEMIAEAVGREKSTLYQYKYVAENIEFSIRIENLSFAHHQVIAGKPQNEQRFWLEKALENGWTVAQLRSELRQENTPEFAASILADRHHKHTVNRVFRALERGQIAKLEDIQQLERWLQEVRFSHTSSK